MPKQIGSGLTYIGNGEAIIGVPARDLSPEEAMKYKDRIKASEAAVGRALYETPAKSTSNKPALEVNSETSVSLGADSDDKE